jgi:hypothetical protein
METLRRVLPRDFPSLVGGWVCALILAPGSRNPGLKRPLDLLSIVLNIQVGRGRVAFACICVLMSYAGCGPITQTVTGQASSTSHRVDTVDDQERQLTAFYRWYELRVEGWKVETNVGLTPTCEVTIGAFVVPARLNVWAFWVQQISKAWWLGG